METTSDAGTQVTMVQLGVLSFSANTLLSLAMVVNVLVINSVKFFFEFLVCLTPIPFLDACFEVLNKTMCAGLMAIYAFSPTLATLVNIILLVLAEAASPNRSYSKKGRIDLATNVDAL